MTRYLQRLKTALTSSPATPLVFVCNFEAEAQWARHHVGLPNVTPSASPVVQRMEELGLLLAGPGDYLVTKYPLDEGYLAYLAELGAWLPTVVVPERTQADRSTTEDLLDSPGSLAALASLSETGARLMPMGTTGDEQKLAEAIGLPLAVPDAVTFEHVNSKIYGRRLAAAAGVRCIPGWCCETVGDLARVFAACRGDLGPASQLVIKDAYGVSGKGLLVLDSPARADRLLAMVARRAQRTGDERLAVVAEHWIPKHMDLNYQVTIDRSGQIRLDFIKQALTEGGTHRGHVIPAALSNAHVAEVEQAAQAVGQRLYRDGFWGVAGVDAIVAADGTLYPVLEINARLNMSTYQGGVLEQFQSASYVALARHYPLTLGRQVSFTEVRGALGPTLWPTSGGHAIVTCFGTLNANAGHRQPPYEGRLYTVLIAPDRARLRVLESAVGDALGQLTSSQGNR